MKIYDISQEVFGCEVYPGDPSPKKIPQLSISNGDVCNLTHFIDGQETIDQVPLDKFIGCAYVAEREGLLTGDDAVRVIEEAKQCNPESAERILIKGDVTVTKEAAKVFAEAKLKLYGNESQTVGPLEAPMEVHLIMLGAKTVLLEGIRLSEVPVGAYLLNAAPINLGGCDGAPCRAVLMSLDL